MQNMREDNADFDPPTERRLMLEDNAQDYLNKGAARRRGYPTTLAQEMGSQDLGSYAGVRAVSPSPRRDVLRRR
eukprot:535549-Prorocentrum_minimum.AAC.1